MTTWDLEEMLTTTRLSQVLAVCCLLEARCSVPTVATGLEGLEPARGPQTVPGEAS